MLNKESIIRCKSCGYEWKQETNEAHNFFYCPKCGMIGLLQEQFNLIEV